MSIFNIVIAVNLFKNTHKYLANFVNVTINRMMFSRLKKNYCHRHPSSGWVC